MATQYQTKEYLATRAYCETDHYYDADPLTPEEEEQMEAEAWVQYNEELDRIAAQQAADLKQRRFEAAMKINAINNEISEAAELDRAVYEIQRRLSSPAARIDIEPIAKIFVAWRELAERMGIDRFLHELDNFLV